MKKRQTHSDKGIRAKKFLGQHFLKDENIAQKISDTLPVKGAKNVLEIGPGTGILTKHLLQKEGYLTVMELDRDSAAYLKQAFKTDHPDFSFKNFSVIEADFLKFDLTTLFPDQEFCITGNFPYNISSQILFKTLAHRDRIPFFSGMFQKEVGRRICEGPGSKTYGILSVLTQAFYQAKYLFTVPPEVFLPPPKVESGVIELIRKPSYQLPCDEALFFKVVKQAFQQRRKTLRNSLKSLIIHPTLKDLPVFNLRPEQLSPTDFMDLTLKIEQQ